MKYEKRRSADGSWTLYSKEFDECYHSLKDGALKEALYKHVIPAFTFTNKQELRILDICFGLGINTLATLYYLQHGKHDIRSLALFSPEFDRELLQLLPTFSYPQELQPFVHVIKSLVERNLYENDKIHIELFVGDAREYIRGLKNIDIVYQDPFSPKKNPLLWTVEYFTQISEILNEDGIVTTYSVATPVRLAMDEAGLFVYEYRVEGVREGTIGSKKKLPLPRIDMQRKRQRSSSKALYDADFI